MELPDNWDDGENNEGIDPVLTDKKKEILLCIKDNGGCNISDLSRKLNYSRPTVRKHVKKLEKNNCLNTKGSNYLIADEKITFHNINKQVISDILDSKYEVIGIISSFLMFVVILYLSQIRYINDVVFATILSYISISPLLLSKFLSLYFSDEYTEVRVDN